MRSIEEKNNVRKGEEKETVDRLSVEEVQISDVERSLLRLHIHMSLYEGIDLNVSQLRLALTFDHNWICT